VLGDDTARRLEERIAALERRVEQLEAGQERGENNLLTEATRGSLATGNPSRDASGFEPPPLEPTKRFDRKANHRRYMREWRARQTALRRQQQA
jgi:hypothetical protein